MVSRFMRSVLFFDLPVVKKSERKAAQKFVRDLKKIGFYMLQESVYVKMNVDTFHSITTIKKVREIKPDKGTAFMLTITEKEFNDMEIILGENKSCVVNSLDRIIEL